MNLKSFGCIRFQSPVLLNRFGDNIICIIIDLLLSSSRTDDFL